MADSQLTYPVYDMAAMAARIVYSDIEPGQQFAELPGLTVDAVFSDCDCLSGFRAAAFADHENGQLVIALCGSNEPRDFASAANLALCQYLPNRERLFDYIYRRTWRRIVVTGHSLGGGLSQYLAYDLARDAGLDDPVVEVVTFNGVGGRFGIKVMHGEIDERVLDRLDVAAFVHPDDVIPRIGRQLTRRVRLVPRAEKIRQHFVVAHRMENFFPRDGRSVLAGAKETHERCFEIFQTSHLLRERLRDVVTDWNERRWRRALINMFMILRLVPRGERYECLRFIVSLTRWRAHGRFIEYAMDQLSQRIRRQQRPVETERYTDEDLTSPGPMTDRSQTIYRGRAV